MLNLRIERIFRAGFAGAILAIIGQMIRATRGRELPKTLCGIAAALVCLCSCEKLFGPDLREIAGGYCLKRAGSSGQFALTIPHESGGLIIDEIGWRKPLILVRASGSEYWDVINTARAEHIRVSDRERKSETIYQSIQIEPVEMAWRELDSKKRLW